MVYHAFCLVLKSITFYGGEPLMNMKTIKYAVRYINQFYKENVYYMLTTNGLLLNDANINPNCRYFLDTDTAELENN